MKTTSEARTCPKCGRNTLHPTSEFRHGKQRWRCVKSRADGGGHCYGTVHPDRPLTGHDNRPVKAVAPRKKFRRKIDHRRILFTAAQNATPIHEGFWNALQALAEDIGAEIAVIPLRYKNPTSIFSASQRGEEWWAQQVRPYLYEQRKKLNDNLVVIGDVKIQPTMQDPLQGLEGLSRNESAIFGHTKLRLKCISTPQSKLPKLLTTTGACTVPNYTDSKAGKKGEFHHVLGACLVEIESRTKYHLHNINARDDGAFIFKTTAYLADGSTEPAGPAQALVFGDAHYRFADPKVVEATFGKGGLVETLDPATLVWHDLLDAYFGNPHHKDPFTKKAKETSGYDIARDEVFETIDWMRSLGKGRHNVIVPSNHDDMFKRWIVREDWKELHGHNMEFYLETALHMARSARMTDVGAAVDDPFVYWLKRRIDETDNIRALSPDEEFLVAKIALNYHGDKGPGGARGTVKNLSQIGVKVISGHGHAPEILDGHTRTGTMTRLTAEYVTGPNNWFNTHASIDAFGKRHLHHCIDGKFYMED